MKDEASNINAGSIRAILFTALRGYLTSVANLAFVFPLLSNQ